MSKSCSNPTCDAPYFRKIDGLPYCSGCWAYIRDNGVVPHRKDCAGCGVRLQQRTADRSDHCGKCAEGLPCEAEVEGQPCRGRRGRGTGLFCYSHYRDVVEGRPFRKVSHRGGKWGCFTHKNPMPCLSCKREAWLKQYGISLAEYEELLAQQGGVCAFDGCTETESVEGRPLSVDHCHATGKVRGLLCMRHNVLLGNAKDSVEELMRAVRYLEAA